MKNETMDRNIEYPLQVILGTCPSKSNSYVIARFGKAASLRKSDAMTKFENSFYIQCNHYRDKNITGYFKFHIDVYYPNERSDLDGALKGTLDCLQKVRAFKDDRKCTEIVARKFLDKNNPRIEFKIYPI